MPDHTIDDLDDIEIEGPGGTQLTHALTKRAAHFDLESEIREHPIRSIALALLGGFLVAKLLD